jgi:hypothetical protein
VDQGCVIVLDCFGSSFKFASCPLKLISSLACYIYLVSIWLVNLQGAEQMESLSIWVFRRLLKR